MNNFREVNDDILKDWLDFREETLCCTLSAEDKKHFVYFDEFSDRILKMFQNRIKSMLRNNLIFLMRILWIIFSIGMRNIIGMDFVMVCS